MQNKKVLGQETIQDWGLLDCGERHRLFERVPSAQKKKIVLFVGTRPEAIKVAPVVRAFKSRPEYFEAYLCSTGQHKEMLAATLKDYDLEPDLNLNIMTKNQGLADMSASLFTSVSDFLKQVRPDAIFVQGDTTSVQVAALCAFYLNIPVAHIEAGLRTWNIQNPFPEELNRRITGMVSRWHFAPTEQSRKNLLEDKVNDKQIIVTGNTVIDALLWVREANRQNVPPLPGRVEEAIAKQKMIILVTSHRRESFGPGLDNICSALAELAQRLPDACLVYPVHMNPNVRGPVLDKLGSIDNIYLEEPLSHRPFVRLMEACKLVLSDSGGIQEEAPSLNKPVLIMRETTERPEGIESGVNLLVGTDPQKIVSETMRLLNDPAAFAEMTQKPNPFGDGQASERIVDHIQESFISVQSA